MPTKGYWHPQIFKPSYGPDQLSAFHNDNFINAAIRNFANPKSFVLSVLFVSNRLDFSQVVKLRLIFIFQIISII